MFLLLCVIVVLALVFDFINGFHDSANAIATVVSTRVLPLSVAVIYAGMLNFMGALMGTEVATTIGKGLVDTGTITLITVLCTVIAAILWNLITWWKGLPTSSSHAMIGSLLGATCFSNAGGIDHIHWNALMQKVIIPMVTSPVMGIAVGFALMTVLTWLVHRMPPRRISRIFGKLQLVSAGFMAVSHGMNDAQKSMGIIALAIVPAHPQDGFAVPLWVKLSCAIAMGLGTMAGGRRIIHTMGSRIIRLQPIQGFAAETTASLIIGLASHLGIPVSTTHVISTAIMGVGSTRRLSAVRWGIVGNIIWAWALTLPLTFVFAGSMMWILKHLI